jgi:putative ABC transport system substrate-binding protein
VISSKRISCLALGATLFALTIHAEAQQPGKAARIGFLFVGSRDQQPHLEAFRRGLRELGYLEGKNITAEYRYAEGKTDRLPELAAELVRLQVDVIVTTTALGAQAAGKVTQTIPIIMATSGDPVGTGLVASLARPGRNITGLTVLAPQLSGKRVELLNESFPRVKRIAVLWNPNLGGGRRLFQETQAAAEALGLDIHSSEIRSVEDIEPAFEAMAKVRVQALVATPEPLTTNNATRIVNLANKRLLPAIYPTTQFVEHGGLMAYALNTADLYYRAATYVDKILKGKNPADLPIEQPTKFDLVVNLNTAKQIGVTISPNVLARADRVIR